MKKTAIVFAIIILSALSAYGQGRVSPNKPYLQLNSRPGYITINEVSFGFGLGATNVPFSSYFYGFTSIHGYQIDESMVIGGGIGLSQFSDGTLIPLFIDLRYRYYVSTFTFYVFGDGGFMINPGDVDAGTKMFINAGPGVRMVLSPTFAVNLSPSLLIQMGPTNRSSFINIKLGGTFKSK